LSTDDKEQVTAEVDDRLDEFFSDDEPREKTHELELDSPVSKDESLDDLLSDDAWNFDDAAPDAAVALDPNADAMDDFLVEDSWADGPPAGAHKKTSSEELGIHELQVAILSLDWEITDEVVDKLVSEAASMRLLRSEDLVCVTFLTLMETLGKYIRKKKAAAHPSSVNLLRKVYDDLEKVLSLKGMDEESRRQIALADVASFVRLKAKINAMERKKGKPAVAKKAAPKIRKAEIIEEIPVRKAQVVEERPVAAPPASAGAALAPQAAEEIARSLAAVKEELLAEIRALPEKIEEAVVRAVSKALAERS